MICFTKVALPFGWLGNMSPHPIQAEDRTWRTAEALFQALRFAPDSSVRDEIHAAKSPMAAKMVAKKRLSQAVVTPRSKEDAENMFEVISLKLDQHLDLLPLLIETGGAELVEDVSARASTSGLFWGKAKINGVWTGQNWLGRIWMKKRELALDAFGG